jgi:RNA recognition motif-containing protein
MRNSDAGGRKIVQCNISVESAAEAPILSVCAMQYAGARDRLNEAGRGMREQKFRGNVFVANLPKGFTDEDLAKAFDPFGIVVGAYLARDSTTGAPKRHGLVNIAPERAAGEAVAALNGTEIGGRRIEARLADPDMALTIPTRLGPRPEQPRFDTAPRRMARPAAAAASYAVAPRTPRPFVVERVTLPPRRA